MTDYQKANYYASVVFALFIWMFLGWWYARRGDDYGILALVVAMMFAWMGSYAGHLDARMTLLAAFMSFCSAVITSAILILAFAA